MICIPDVVAMALPYRAEPVFTQPPHLVIEIVSLDDRPGDMLAKVAEYLNFGVPHVWIPALYRRGCRKPTAMVSGTVLIWSWRRTSWDVWTSANCL